MALLVLCQKDNKWRKYARAIFNSAAEISSVGVRSVG